MSGDYLAALLVKNEHRPSGRVHLHAFVKRNSLTRVAVYEDGDMLPVKYARQRIAVAAFPKKTILDGRIEWRVSRRPSSVCKVPGRCILADIVE